MVTKSNIKTDRQGTSIPRNTLSLPVKTAIVKGVLVSGNTIHDYGCGKHEYIQKHGNDVTRLQSLGYDATGHDLDHGSKRQADVVFCSYVINVIENPSDRANVVKDAYSLANKMLILSARTDSNSLKKSKVSAMNDGVLTVKNTFQKFYTTQSLKDYVKEVLGKDSKTLRNGSVIITKE